MRLIDETSSIKKTGNKQTNLAGMKQPDERLQNLERQYALTRQKLKGTKQELGRQSDDAFKRFAAQQGLQGSGALLKAKGTAQQHLGQQFGDIEAGLGAEEAAAREGILGEREIRGSEQEFAAREAEKARQSQEMMFGKQLDFQKGSWADQFGLMQREFDENLKTNIINAAIALHSAGLRDAKDWHKLLSGDPKRPGMLQYMYPDRTLPTIGKDDYSVGFKRKQDYYVR